MLQFWFSVQVRTENLKKLRRNNVILKILRPWKFQQRILCSKLYHETIYSKKTNVTVFLSKVPNSNEHVPKLEQRRLMGVPQHRNPILLVDFMLATTFPNCPKVQWRGLVHI